MCEYCLNDTCPVGCPNYEEKSTGLICSKCKEEILFYEEYIENEYGEVVHLDCMLDIYDLLEWLGYKINIKEE